MLRNKEAICKRAAGLLRGEMRVLNVLRRDVKIVGQYLRGTV